MMIGDIIKYSFLIHNGQYNFEDNSDNQILEFSMESVSIKAYRNRHTNNDTVSVAVPIYMPNLVFAGLKLVQLQTCLFCNLQEF